MPGRIRTSLSKIDTVVPRFHSSLEDRKWWHGDCQWIRRDCVCNQCKASKLKLNRDTLEGVKIPSRDTIAPKGRTYRQQIEESLKGIEYTVEEKDGYITYQW